MTQTWITYESKLLLLWQTHICFHKFCHNNKAAITYATLLLDLCGSGKRCSKKGTIYKNYFNRIYCTHWWMNGKQNMFLYSPIIFLLQRIFSATHVIGSPTNLYWSQEKSYFTLNRYYIFFIKRATSTGADVSFKPEINWVCQYYFIFFFLLYELLANWWD